MTNRYDLFIDAMLNTDLFITRMFLFALIVILAYRTLEWVPSFFRRPSQAFYLVMMLALFIFVTVYSWQ